MLRIRKSLTLSQSNESSDSDDEKGNQFGTGENNADPVGKLNTDHVYCTNTYCGIKKNRFI